MSHTLLRVKKVNTEKKRVCTIGNKEKSETTGLYIKKVENEKKKECTMENKEKSEIWLTSAKKRKSSTLNVGCSMSIHFMEYILCDMYNFQFQ